MSRPMPLLAAFVALTGLSLASCTTTYTPAELAAEERKEDAAARSEEKRDREIGEEGGANVQAIDEEIEGLEE